MFLPEVPMKASFSVRWTATLLAASLVTLPSIGAQSQQAPSAQQQPPAQQPTNGQATAQSGSGNQAGQPAVIPQQADPNVKAGSEADVNSIGDRNVGKGLDFYSLEKEIALGKQLAQE